MYPNSKMSIEISCLLGEWDLDGLGEVGRRGVEARLVRVPVHHVGQAVST